MIDINNTLLQAVAAHRDKANTYNREIAPVIDDLRAVLHIFDEQVQGTGLNLQVERGPDYTPIFEKLKQAGKTPLVDEFICFAKGNTCIAHVLCTDNESRNNYVIKLEHAMVLIGGLSEKDFVSDEIHAASLIKKDSLSAAFTDVSDVADYIRLVADISAGMQQRLRSK